VGKASNATAVDQFFGQLAEAMCGWQFRCCALPEVDADNPAGYVTEVACRPAVTRRIDDQISELRLAFAAGRLSFDPEVASQCLQSFTKGSCNLTVDPNNMMLNAPIQSLWDRFAACPNPFVGKLPMGSECFLPMECQPGQSCKSGGDLPWGFTDNGLRIGYLISDSGSEWRGHCLPDVPTGSPCSITAECGPGQYCRGTDMVCALPGNEGDVCEETDQGAGATVFQLACADGPVPLRCGGGHCRRLPRTGEPCLSATTTTTLCDPSSNPALTCVGRSINGDGVCTPVAQQGDVCVMKGPGVGGGIASCVDGLACNGDATSATTGLGHCGPAPAIGAPCALDLRCAAPAVCYLGTNGISASASTTGVCVLPGATRDAGPCQSDLDCVSLSCRSTNGVGVCGTGASVCAGAQNYVASGLTPPSSAPPAK
jgi:hypothetical protein